MCFELKIKRWREESELQVCGARGEKKGGLWFRAGYPIPL